MRFTRYSKWTGQSWDDISLEELMEALSDHLLRSGFEDQFRRHYQRWSQDWGYDDFDDQGRLTEEVAKVFGVRPYHRRWDSRI